MTVVAYDKPVQDFIAGLDATGHVTHTAYRKTSVTFHHNGGRLSLQGILDVWKTREASAHFQADGQGRLGQYVRVNEYAWACGNTDGNKSSISIEMANATLEPTWTVAKVTWYEAARLAGWLHYKVIGVRPSRATCHVHHDWKSTTCAGPYIDSVLDEMIAVAQKAYDYFASKDGAAPPSTPTTPGKKSITTIAREVIAGDWANNPERSRRLQAAGYSPTAVQAEVNRLMGGGTTVVRLSVSALADQVIAGQWGNGPERRRRLTAAGYDYNAVQAEVNRRV